MSSTYTSYFKSILNITWKNTGVVWQNCWLLKILTQLLTQICFNKELTRMNGTILTSLWLLLNNNSLSFEKCPLRDSNILRLVSKVSFFFSFFFLNLSPKKDLNKIPWKCPVFLVWIRYLSFKISVYLLEGRFKNGKLNPKNRNYTLSFVETLT